ncbi:MAG: helix-turn-helix domain-containing protein [Actinomycetota bacterium]
MRAAVRKDLLCASTRANFSKHMALQKVVELGSFIREQRQRAQMSLRTVANLSGISNPYLSQIERGLRKPSAEILQGIAKALKISAETLYVKAGILEDTGGADVVAAIQSDQRLDRRQKDALINIFESYIQSSEDDGNQTPSADDASGEDRVV